MCQVSPSQYADLCNKSFIMKNYIIFLACLAMACQSSTAQKNNTAMSTTTVNTSIGEIAYYAQEVEGTTPIIFLHGVYYDHHLWDYYVSRIQDRTTITIDMPMHGKSQTIHERKWTMDDCSQMLIEILDSLGVEKCYAIGHSWGSMTLLRAASQHPERFVRLGLGNMPLEAGTFGAKLQFGLQHTMLSFRGFYTKQVAKAMFAKESREEKPEIVEYLELSMSQLSNKAIRQTDRAVISRVGSGYPYLEQLQVPALALRGKQDYVPDPPGIATTLVSGQHTSPLEAPEQVLEWIREVMTRKQ